VLSLTANGQLQSQHEYKQQHQSDNTGQNEKKTTKKQRKMDQIRLFTLRHELLKISLLLYIISAEETRVTDGQWLKN
jgi:hypothetical protein